MSMGCSDIIKGAETYDTALVYEAETIEAVAFDDYDGEKKIREQNAIANNTYTNIQSFNNELINSSMTLYNPQENYVLSPLNIYMTLAFIQEGASQETKSEIEALINRQDQSSQVFRDQIGNLYRRLYLDNEIGQLILSNSLWLDHDLSFKDSFLEYVSPYYTELFSVDFSDKHLPKVMDQWISDKTKGLLDANTEIKEEEVLKVISTLYFYDEWLDKFNESNTHVGDFKINNQDQVSVDFMKGFLGSHKFRRNDYFESTSISTKNGFHMTFYLPRNNYTVDDLLSDRRILETILALDYDDSYVGEVTLEVPKFSFGDELKLKETMKLLGIESAFSREANFNPMVDTDILYISDIIHRSHIGIDEKGVEAASFTQIDYCGSMPPSDKLDMLLDRPFIFTLSNYQGICLYFGVVNNPELE